MGTLTHTTQLTTTHCGVTGCGIAFAIPTWLYDKANADHGIRFWCPNGHKVGYFGPSDVERAQQRARGLERQLANKDEDLRSARASLIATRGHLTRAKKRADNGVCQHCNRSFENVTRHVRDMHPGAVSR